MNTWFIAALIMGFAGSAHCIGMCGPIALALPVNRESKITKIAGISSYNFGRIVTYTTLGALFGFFGQGLKLVGLLQGMSILFGVLIILMIAIPTTFNRFLNKNLFYLKFNNYLKSKLGKLFKSKSNFSMFTLGILNGLLPCGLVFAAIIGAIETSSTINGAIFMMFFGIGTVPAMFALPWISSSISNAFRAKIRRFVPLVMFFFGAIFILRGMNLNIPLVSPKIEVKNNIEVLDCCGNNSNCENK